MEKNVGYFQAAFRDGRVYIAGKSLAAGTFCTYLLNQYYNNDTAARIAVFKSSNLEVQRELKQGYINPTEFVNCNTEIQYILETLSKTQPFALLDAEAEKVRNTQLFTEENAEKIIDYFRRKAKVSLMDEGAAALGVLPKDYDKQFFYDSEILLQNVEATLNFYDSLSEDMRKAFENLKLFISRTNEAERLDEAHLLPIAYEIFGRVPFSVKSEYVPIKKRKNSKEFVAARRLYFESYYSFILTDFFEGLHYGHYPRLCPVCKKYFLMKNARHQVYCNGYSNEYLPNGNRLTCRKVGAMWQRNEKADADPIKVTYIKRTGCIRAELSKGIITEEFSNAAKKLAKKHRDMALMEQNYAQKQYALDMQKDKLYRDTAELLKK